MVVADDERDRGVVRDRDIEALLGANDVRCVRAHGRDRLVEIEIGTAGGPGTEREQSEQREQEDLAEQPDARARRRRRLLVADDRRRWRRREA